MIMILEIAITLIKIPFKICEGKCCLYVLWHGMNVIRSYCDDKIKHLQTRIP